MMIRLNGCAGTRAGIFCISLLMLFVAGCASQNAGPGTRGDEARLSPADAAQRAADQGDYAEAAARYGEAAGRATNADTQRKYRLEAGLAAAQAGDVQTARQMLASQLGRDERKARATDLLHNDSSEAELISHVASLHQHYLAASTTDFRQAAALRLPPP